MPRVVAIIQARMTSSRLPGKVLLDLAGASVLERVVRRTGLARGVDEVVVATTGDPADEPIVTLCRRRGWPCFRGNRDDVLDRYYRAAAAFRADVVVRITSDCPLIDPDVAGQVVAAWLAGQPGVDYASNVVPRRTFPRGLDTEVFGIASLERAWREDSNPAWREHVTPYLYRNPAEFRCRLVECGDVTWPFAPRKNAAFAERRATLAATPDLGALRWTIDTPEDYHLVRSVYEAFGHDRFGWRDVLDLLAKHPDWCEINAGVQQKQVLGPCPIRKAS